MMADIEHAEWLRDEEKRKQQAGKHSIAAKKRKTFADDREQSATETDEAQEDADDAADDALEEGAAQDRQDGQQAGQAV